MSVNQTVDEALAELVATYAYGLNAVWVILTGIGIVTMQVRLMKRALTSTHASSTDMCTYTYRLGSWPLK